MGREFILCDLDRTLSNSFNRDEMIGVVPWDEYHSEAIYDEPLWDIAEVVSFLGEQYQIVGITARPEKWRIRTLAWLTKHNIKLHSLLMRPEDNYDPAPALKVYLAQCFFEGALKENIRFILDDREDVIAAFKAQGVTGLVVHGRRD